MHMLWRIGVLFGAGVFLSVLFNLLQTQHHVTQFPPDVARILSSAWWIPVACGYATVLVGLAYPAVDAWLGQPHTFKRDWSSVMRCVGVFIGINYASAKLPFSTNVQLSCMLALMAIGLWWLFDRTIRGFALSLIVAACSTISVQLIVYFGLFRYTQPDFVGVRSWIPCVFFAAGVTFGCIGRQLAFDDDSSRKGITAALSATNKAKVD
eukprot:Opistho-2@72923